MFPSRLILQGKQTAGRQRGGRLPNGDPGTVVAPAGSTQGRGRASEEGGVCVCVVSGGAGEGEQVRGRPRGALDSKGGWQPSRGWTPGLELGGEAAGGPKGQASGAASSSVGEGLAPQLGGPEDAPLCLA